MYLVTKNTIHSFIHVLSSQENTVHGENYCIISCKTSSCFETLNGPVSFSTVLTQTTTSLYEMLDFNSIGISGSKLPQE